MAYGEMAAGTQPQEIEDEEHEQILERPAAVDTAKASGMACTTLPACCQTSVSRASDVSGHNAYHPGLGWHAYHPVWAGVVGYSRRQGKRVITSRNAQPLPRGVRTRLTRITADLC
jgi:hypothetical protein